jgi:hypothetical protein
MTPGFSKRFSAFKKIDGLDAGHFVSIRQCVDVDRLLCRASNHAHPDQTAFHCLTRFWLSLYRANAGMAWSSVGVCSKTVPENMANTGHARSALGHMALKIGP